MTANTIAEITDAVRSSPRITACGGGSKPGLAYRSQDATRLELSGLSGLLEYQPEEFTFTAYAGTPLREVLPALAEYKQYLPFDPPLVGSGATLGGTVAAGLSGAGRYRFGGVRDFLLGVEFVNAEGDLISSGGKVVKNAAGFDLPKLMVGSLGQYGAFVELAFKVFPYPEATATLSLSFPDLQAALDGLVRLTLEPLELYALELEPRSGEAVLRVRVGGKSVSLPKRIERLRTLLPSAQTQVIEGDVEVKTWEVEREFAWVPEGHSLIKVPITPKRVLSLDEQLSKANVLRRYSVGANIAWVAWPEALAEIDGLLSRLDLTGLAVLGPAGNPLLGKKSGSEFARRVKAALDPLGKFVSF